MLIHPYDAALSEDEWRAFLADHPFGQLVASGRGRDVPTVVPTHYAIDSNLVLMHFARPNPIWAAIVENPRALFTVIGDYTYVPSATNADPDEPPEYGVPTSYYGAVQLEGECEIVDDPARLADVLTKLMARMQPEGGHAPIEPGDNLYARQFSAIRGLVMRVDNARAKFKYGGNRTREHREKVAAALAERDGPMDAEARAHLLRRHDAMRR